MLALAEDARRDCRRRRSCVCGSACVDADPHRAPRRLRRWRGDRRPQLRAGTLRRRDRLQPPDPRPLRRQDRLGPARGARCRPECRCRSQRCARRHASQPDRAAGALVPLEDRCRRRLARQALQPGGRRRDGDRRDGERPAVLTVEERPCGRRDDDADGARSGAARRHAGAADAPDTSGGTEADCRDASGR